VGDQEAFRGLPMKKLLAAIAALLAITGAAHGIDAQSQAVVDRYKADKPVAIEDVAVLMKGSERWCYGQVEESCEWTDIYLDVDDTGAKYEIANAWSENVDVAFTDRGEFRDGRYICETGYDWVPSVYATQRSDGSLLRGRKLAALKGEIYANRGNFPDEKNCFDYLFVSADNLADVVTLLQRQYDEDGATDTANDVEVTLHFDAEKAAALTLKW
jgi:hypothetical protein